MSLMRWLVLFVMVLMLISGIRAGYCHNYMRMSVDACLFVLNGFNFLSLKS